MPAKTFEVIDTTDLIIGLNDASRPFAIRITDTPLSSYRGRLATQRIYHIRYETKAQAQAARRRLENAN